MLIPIMNRVPELKGKFSEITLKSHFYRELLVKLTDYLRKLYPCRQRQFLNRSSRVVNSFWKLFGLYINVKIEDLLWKIHCLWEYCQVDIMA